MERVVVEVPINNGFSLAGPSTTPRKRQVRFSARHDIILLREVIAQNPFASKEPGRLWARVGEIITTALQDENFEVDARRCRERTMLLLDYYKKQDFPSLRRFGTERLYAQKEDLLHEVLELEAEKGLLASGESTKYQDDELRKRAMEELTLPEQEKPNITITQTPTAGQFLLSHQKKSMSQSEAVVTLGLQQLPVLSSLQGSECFLLKIKTLVEHNLNPSTQPSISSSSACNQKKTARKWQSFQQRPWPSGPASAAARPTLRFSASWRNAQRRSNGCERRSLPCAERS
ncbi:uncharacterized protein si:dkey-45d16.4 isoform X4 [Siniperca chuatsi]|uniref:uncharacterized protein si:dkey-45d16.4 isoform X4 n=1 Tax=Siniperca chuatsi TaxID=119488 RepID=UPI001CE17EFD|nr:uncharacterized protein si:dkey-45d16.4 isoform X4 [Siniperca chuatsi]